MTQHLPVLLNEVLEGLLTDPSGTYVDATFGRGGHSRAMLERLGEDARLVGMDRDPEAITAGQRLQASDPRFSIRHGRFSGLTEVLDASQCKAGVQGVLMDIGVSSPQLDDAGRGFSFNAEGPLDMRMDCTQGQTAANWLNTAKAEDIARVLYVHGEERRARRIAAAIVEARPLETTLELAELVERCVPRGRHPSRKHPATKTFQAIRIFINDEDVELQQGLEAAFESLAIGGRLAVISFHSLEDRKVKHTFRSLCRPPALPRHIPIPEPLQAVSARPVGGVIRASEAELIRNPRSRGAVLRIIERLP